MMNKKPHLSFILLFSLLVSACSSSEKGTQDQTAQDVADDFKVIGYYYYVPSGPSAEDLDISGLTHINYSFAMPEKEGNGLEPLSHPDNLRKTVELAHQKGKKVFISLGGWNLGDGGGDDSRFHRMAKTEAGRMEFNTAVMDMVEEFHLDGVDMDWEYPEDDSSADDFIALMGSLAEQLHTKQKELSVAVVSYDGRLSSIGKIAEAKGIKKEVFDIVDWVNIMAYDDENGKVYPDNAHSTYELAEKCLHYWIDERGLPSRKAVLGLPLYAKPGYLSYKALLEQGAAPSKDSFKEVFYNGTETMKAKTKLALERNCGGVMMWEISQDVKGEHSLIRAMNEAIAEFKSGRL
jgi:chitinase